MPQRIQNIGILAHVDSGKTSITEQLLYLMGCVRSAGSVDSGTASTDSLDIEKQRGISVRTATASGTWKETLINIIDTPGHTDFAGEVERALLALDYAVVIISAVEGIRAHTENIIKALDEANLPRIILINKIDRPGSDCAAIFKDLERLNSSEYVMLSRFNKEGTEKAEVSLIDDDEFSLSATQALAEFNDEAADVFLNDKTLPYETCEKLVRDAINDCRITPVVVSSAKYSSGIKELADTLVKLMPVSDRKKTDELCGVIYKIEHDKAHGKLAHIRMFGGEIINRNEIELIPIESKNIKYEDTVNFDTNPNSIEKVSQIKKFTGAKLSDCGSVTAGNIAVISGLSSAVTGQYIGSVFNGTSSKLVNPFLRVRISVKDGEEQKIPELAKALKELSDEEPYINSDWENGQKEITINTTGKIQLEVIASLLRQRYNIDAVFSPPSVIYKETPSSKGYAYADYTMPKPCWAVVKFLFEPMPRGYGVSYHGRLPNNKCFYKYQSHIRNSFNTCLEQGLYGWEVTDFKCTLVDGEHHTIHTHPLDFFVCTPMAFMNGLSSLGSTLLEPLIKVRITAPEEYSGKILSEIIKMNGEYDSPVSDMVISTVEAIIPVATSMDFPTRLAVMTGGKAVMNQSFYGYRECTDSQQHINPRKGVNPLDRSKWILSSRGAINIQ